MNYDKIVRVKLTLIHTKLTFDKMLKMAKEYKLRDR